MLIGSSLFASPALAQEAPPVDAQWASLFVRPTNTYTATYERTTSPTCPADVACIAVVEVEEVQITVVNGRLANAVNVRTGEPGVNALTITDWFAEIQRAAGADQLREAGMNDVYGYPELYTLDLPEATVFMRTLDFNWGAVRSYQLDQYDRALAAWVENRPEAYRFEYSTDCGECLLTPDVIITVRGDEIVDIDTVRGVDIPIPDEMRVTVDDLLARVERAINDPSSNDNVWFDFRYGHPTTFSSAPSDPLIADGEYQFAVSDLRTLNPWPEVQAALDEARPKFDATTYTLTYRRLCFCLNREPIVVEVVDGVIRSVDGEDARWALTVPRMFEAIQSAINNDVDGLSAAFDPMSGHPTRYSIDQSFQIADEEYSVEVLSLVEGPAEPLGCTGLGYGAASAELSGRMELLEIDDNRLVIGATDGSNTYTLDPTSYAEFCVVVDNPGLYRLDASVMGSGQNSDSFWVEVNDDLDVWHLPRSSTFVPATAQNADGMRLFELEAGEHRVRFYLRETGSLIEDFLLVREGALEVAEASCSSTLGQDAAGGAAANGAFELITVEDQPATMNIPDNVRNRYQLDREHYGEFCVTVDRSNLFTLSAAVLARDGNSNSFWVQIDGGEPVVWHIPVAPEFTTRRLPAPAVRLDAGEHRIRFFHREDTPVAFAELEPLGR